MSFATRLMRFWESREAANGDGRWIRVIRDFKRNEPYLIRYYICSTRWLDDVLFERVPLLRPLLGWASFRVVLHRTLKSDDDIALHDHPWSWFSLILSGGYYEHTPEGVFWRAPGTFRFRSANSFHRLELDPSRSAEQEVISLFLMGPREKQWGFLDLTYGWTYWQDYLAKHRPGMKESFGER